MLVRKPWIAPAIYIYIWVKCGWPHIDMSWVDVYCFATLLVRQYHPTATNHDTTCKMNTSPLLSLPDVADQPRCRGTLGAQARSQRDVEAYIQG